MKPKVYIETTIVSYLAARPSRDLITAAHQQVTQEWWENRRTDFDLFVSQLVIQEASAGDEQAVQRRLQVLEDLPLLQLNEQAIALARMLIDEGTLSSQAAGDALHIAVATVHGMDYLLTWNLKHLANATIRNAITVTCRARDYEPPVICTPEELLEE
jgi:predicted nucleic acid-binding protein